jgi:hypothetical protein
MYRFNNTIKNNKTCEKCDRTKLVIYSKCTTAEVAATERERESTLTVIHSCHRPRIPFGHVLIERSCFIKHCKRGCNKERKDQPSTNNNKRAPFQKHKIKNNKTCENCGPRNRGNSSCQKYSKYTAAEGVVKERERVHILDCKSVTALVFHLDKF